MTRIRVRTSFALGVLAQLSAIACAAPALYDCAYLEDVGDEIGSEPRSINEHGDISGDVALEWPLLRAAAIWKIGKAPVVLPLDDRYYAEGHDINDRGQVVGVGSTHAEGTRAVTWRHGQAINLYKPPGEYVGDRAFALNNHGVIVGVIPMQSGFGRHAAVWHGDRLFDLGTLGGPKGHADRISIATDVNESDTVVGQSQVFRYKPHKGMHAVRWDSARTIVDLGTLPGGLISMASKINTAGVVVGYSEFEGSLTRVHATAWSNGAVRDLGTLPGHDESLASSINDAGVVVGISNSPGEATWRAVAWYGLDQAPTDLNTQVDMASCPDYRGNVYTLQWARAINGSGQIAASGRSVSGQLYAGFRLVPR